MGRADLTPATIPGTAAERLLLLGTLTSRLQDPSAALRLWAVRGLGAIAEDGVDLAPSASALLRAGIDPERVPHERGPIARDARVTLAKAIAATARREDFVAAAKALDGDLDDAQRMALRKLLRAILPEALVVVAGRGRAPRRGRPPNEEALLQGVFDDLSDDGPRLVYADALLGAGDARGELIILQCERATKGTPPTAREQELLRLNGRAWLGPLANAIAEPHWVRGFLVSCVWKQGRFGFDETRVHGHPVWGTVEEIRMRHGSFFHDDNALVSHPVMRALRTLTGLARVSFVNIERSELEHLGLIHFEADGKTLDALERHGRLTRLDVDRDPAGLFGWALERHPGIRTIGWDGRRYERDGDRWRGPSA